MSSGRRWLLAAAAPVAAGGGAPVAASSAVPPGAGSSPPGARSPSVFAQLVVVFQDRELPALGIARTRAKGGAGFEVKWLRVVVIMVVTMMMVTRMMILGR